MAETLYIKNMVCDRCIMAVRAVLTRCCGIEPLAVELGEVRLPRPLTEQEHETLRRELEDLAARCQKQLQMKLSFDGAAVSALAISGLPTGRFAFEGFLPAAKKQRTARLAELTGEQRTLIFYEAPHRLTATLEDLYQAFGERRIALCRELTKLYEQVLRMTLPEAISYYKEKAPRGEYVLVLEGAAREDAPALTFEEVLEQVRRQVDAGMRAADACKTAAKASGFSKNELYRALLEG